MFYFCSRLLVSCNWSGYNCSCTIVTIRKASFLPFFFQNVIRSFCLFSSKSVILTVKTIALSFAVLKFSQNQFVRCHIRPIRNLKEIKNSQLTLIFRFFLADNIIKRKI